MAKSTDTRARTKEAAAALLAQGVRPTARKVLKMLGTGSLSTISSELTLLGYGPPDEGAAHAGEPGSEHPSKAPTPALPPAAISAELPTLLARMADELTRLREEMAAQRISSEQQLAQAYSRYEAVQRQAMLQIDAARQEATELRERVRNAGLDAEVRESALRGQNQRLREENQQLRQKLEAMSDE